MIVGKICIGLTNAQRYIIYPLTEGLTGAELEIEYMHPVWKQLRKLVTFRAGKEIRSVWDETGTVKIPWEVLQRHGRVLRVGVTGTSVENEIIVPTIEVGFDQQIQDSADPGPEAGEPTLPLWAQLDSRVKQLEDSKQDQESLQSAINEALEQAKASGMFDGEKGEPGVGIFSIKQTSGNGSPGTTDVYTITHTDNTFSTFSVYNGKNGADGKDYVLTVADLHEIAEQAAQLVKIPEDGLTEQEFSVDLNITGFARANGTFSAAASGLRTDYVPMDGVTKIYGNAGFASSCATIAFYDADKVFLSDISALGTAFLAGTVYGEGSFELDVSGPTYANAAYFVVSSYRNSDPAYSYNQTFGDDYCKFTKLVDGEEEKFLYRISQKTIAFFGDSITSGAGEGDYPSLIASITGATVTNHGKSGATLATGTTATYHIADLVNSYTGTDDIICISGGLNDMNQSVPIGTLTTGYAEELDTTTVIGALESIFRKLLTDHTEAKIYYVITHKAASAEVNKNSLGLTFTDYHDALVDVLGKYSIPFYDAFANSGFITSSYTAWGENMRTLYTVNADGVHPNADGYMKYYVYPIIAMMEYEQGNGRSGKDGKDGSTPVKGTDYFTDADKSEMVSAVIAALPVYDGEVTAE